jgi:hypothetical protein
LLEKKNKTSKAGFTPFGREKKLKCRRPFGPEITQITQIKNLTGMLCRRLIDLKQKKPEDMLGREITG